MPSAEVSSEAAASGRSTIGLLERWRERRPSEALAVTVLAVLLATALFLVGVTVYVASLRQDELQRRHDKDIVAANLAILQRAVVNNVVDYAWWDDAVRHLVLTFDPLWAARNIGPNVHTNFGYDVSLLVAPDGRGVYGQFGGAEDTEAAGASLGRAKPALVAQARRQAGTSPQPVSAILAGPEGLLVVAASAIMPEAGSTLAPAPGAPSVLLFAKRLDGEFLRQLETDFGLNDPALVGPNMLARDAASVPLYGPDGDVVGHLTWTPRRPGREQLAWSVPALAGALLAIAIFASMALRALRLAHDLRLSEARLRDATDVSADWLWETDEDLRFTWLSPGFTSCTGIKLEDVLGRRREELRGDGPGEGNWAQHLADLAARRPFREFRYAIRDAAGKRRMIRASGKPLFDAAGNFKGYRGTSRDIDEDWQAAQRLRESETKFRSLVENMRGIVFCHGIAGNGPDGFDEQGAQVFGVDASWIAGTMDERKRAGMARWYDGIHPDDRAAFTAAEQGRLERGESYTLEYRIIHPVTGEVRWVRDTAWVVDDPELGVRYLDSYIIDVTEQRQREAALARARSQLQAQNEELREARRAAEAATRAKSDFLAAMSHEIRTPMTAVLGMADLLAAEELDQRQQGYVAAIRSSGRHLLSVINDILDFSRIEAGRLELEAVDFSIAQVLEDVRSLMTPQAVERGLRLDFTLDENAPTVVRGDPTRLKQVLLNLVSNGLKFTHAGGITVTVRHRLPDEHATRFRFEVRDTGIGIPVERQAELFHAFTQADRSTARRYGGSGLGLTICKRLIEAMGGVIGVVSEPGRGSLFWFELPLSSGDAEAAAEREACDLAAVPPLRILVAEDVPLNQDLLREMLGRHGHEVVIVANGALAVDMAAAERFDLVLMDMQMPVMDGIEATRRIRRLNPPAGGMPIVGLTANVTEVERRRCLAAGMTVVLSKPIAWSELFVTLASLTKNGTVASGAAPAETKAEPTQNTTVAPGTSPVRPAARTEAETEAPVFDHDRLAALGQGMPPELLSNFLDEAMLEAEQAYQALAAATDRPEEARRLAHRLAGTMLSLGLARIGRIAREIEDRAERGENVADLTARLGQAVAATRTGLGQIKRAA